MALAGDHDHIVRVRLGDYDRTRELVIDPVLAWSTYLGGSNEEGDWWSTGPVFGIATDADGNAYVTGTTLSVDFPTTPGADGALGNQDAFVTKFSPAGAVSTPAAPAMGGGPSLSVPVVQRS